MFISQQNQSELVVSYSWFTDGRSWHLISAVYGEILCLHFSTMDSVLLPIMFNVSK